MKEMWTYFPAQKIFVVMTRLERLCERIHRNDRQAVCRQLEGDTQATGCNIPLKSHQPLLHQSELRGINLKILKCIMNLRAHCTKLYLHPFFLMILPSTTSALNEGSRHKLWAPEQILTPH